MLWIELTKTWALFCTEWSPSKMGNVPLKIFAKSLNLCSEKGTNPMYASHLGAIEQGGGGAGR